MNSEYRGKYGGYYITKLMTTFRSERIFMDTYRIYSYEEQCENVKRLLRKYAHGRTYTSTQICKNLFFIKNGGQKKDSSKERGEIVKKIDLGSQLARNMYYSRSRELFKSSYTLEIQVLYIKKPKIRRRIIVTGSVSIYDFFDRIFVPVMGYLRNHHSFFIETKPFGPNTEDGFIFGVKNSNLVDTIFKFDYRKCFLDCDNLYISDFLKEEGDEIRLTYDLGDRIVHSIKCEKIEKLKRPYIDLLSGEGTPMVVDGLDEHSLEWDQAMDIVQNLKKRARTEIVNLIEGRPNYKDLGIKFPDDDISFFDINFFKAHLHYNLRSKPSMMMFIPEGSENEQAQEYSLKICKVCRTGSKKLKKCSQCLICRYCSKKCQVQDWKREHKRTCRQLLDYPIVHEEYKKRREEHLRFRGDMTMDGILDVFNNMNTFKPEHLLEMVGLTE